MATIEVTAEDIAATNANGDYSRWPGAYCPLARAISREVGVTLGNVCVYDDHVRLDDGCRYALPRDARRFVFQFDGHRNAEPATFEIDLDNEICLDEDEDE